VSTLDRLIGLSLVAIGDTTAAYLAGGSLKAWQRDMERAISTAATATYLAATAERLGLNINSPLFNRNRLTRAERADITRQIEAQRQYLQGFVADIQAGKMSPAQIAARANLYAAGTVRTFYYESRYGDWEIPQNLLPGQQECLGSCLCRVQVIDNGDGTGILRREMGGTEHHCTECPQLQGDHPIRRKRQ
jgi:hypothetical protein